MSFSLPPFHPYDVAVLLDQQGVAVRSGTHCAHPLFDALGMPQGVVRTSLGLYNTLEDVERLCRALGGLPPSNCEEAAVMTLQEKQEGYLQELGSLEDEFDQYTWLMQLACQRPELCQVAHQEERRFLGCQSTCGWSWAARRGGSPSRWTATP